ncbi:MAG: HAMP domain-containing histidine kinase, partial [Lachnospiraceae bacterium]|nr:HAMP domain-containing histidine kinase [Lachnospiraceae bacterium]
MKRFTRTLTGKTILFITCIASFCILAAAIAGICFYIEYDLRFYTLSEQELQKEVIEENELRSYAYSILWIELSGEGAVPDYRGINYEIRDSRGEVSAKSALFTSSGTKVYSFSYCALRDEKGKLFHLSYGASASTDDAESYEVSLTLTEGSQRAGEIELLSKLLHIGYLLRYAVYFIAPAALLVLIGSFVALMHAAGRSADSEAFRPGPLYKIPYDLLLIICLGLGGFILIAINENLGGFPCLIAILISCFLGLHVLLALSMSAAGRIKQHALLKNTLLYHFWQLFRKFALMAFDALKKLCGFTADLLRGIPLIWKTVFISCGISLLELFTIVLGDGRQELLVIFWFFEKLLLLPAIFYLALTLRKLLKSGDALANGDLAYHTDTKGMFWDFRRHGENLNNIAGGMAIAVEERLKSERMKTELITNVSHDIKTPLTSIINYASLIGNEESGSPKIPEYAEVLVRQSEKLKRLIEDLVEASKASSGSLDVILAPCEASVFLTQAGGEYEEKLRKAELTLVMKQPEKELRIMADGRRMWRIFDNLMNNICKYALAGTRVYLSLKEQDGNAVISFKNTSREALDMSEEELIERFTRGDASRSSEGNGLGLSIAKSMAELQGGELRLAIDGDLFKAVLTF